SVFAVAWMCMFASACSVASVRCSPLFTFFFQAEDGIRDATVTGVQTCALPILIYFQLSKQQLMYGPMQIESRIDQDQNISKDLTLWNQQGSHVLRGSIIALPLEGGFLYVESIYIQATEARKPQLKKVVLAIGDRLIYRDTFEEAFAELTGAAPAKPALAAVSTASPSAPTAAERELPALAGQLRRLREQAEELARELQVLEKHANKK